MESNWLPSTDCGCFSIRGTHAGRTQVIMMSDWLSPNPPHITGLITCKQIEKMPTLQKKIKESFRHIDFSANPHLIPTHHPKWLKMARLQSFDDSFVFQGKRSTGGSKRKTEVPQFTLVGNAVPPLLARAVAMEILNHIK